MITKKTFVKKFSASFLTTLVILAGMGAAFAVWTATETSWTETSFNDGAAISNNMLSAKLLGYTKNSSGQKIYWQMLENATKDRSTAISMCKEKGMNLPDMSQYVWLRNKTLPGLNYDGSYINMGTSLTNRSSQFWTIDGGNQNSYSCYGNTIQPGYDHHSSRSSYASITQCYSANYYICVY